MSDGDGALAGWVGALISGIVGVLTGAAVLVRLAFGANARLLKLENVDNRSIVRDELERERHDVLYPMLQTRVYHPIDKIEEELKIQGQNIAVLLERDRTAAALERVVGEMAKAVASAVTEALKNQR